jgi:thioredoxin-like negative regulator of GroEL
LLVACCWLPAAASHAQEVAWRQDYNKARQEARDKGLPLVIDIGTENCYWCRQLDQRTFKDPGLASFLNEQTIPLRIDANRSPALAEALRIQSYPTIVFAAPDGRILGYQEGFVESPRLRDQAGRAVAAVVVPAAPEWMTRDMQEAARVAASEPARAVALLRGVVEDGKDRPIQLRARQMLQDVEAQAAAQLVRARGLAEAGRQADAADELTRLSRDYAGTPAARDGGQLLATLTARTEPVDSPRSRRARELLVQAREDYRMQQFSSCLERCEMLTTNFYDLAEGVEAQRLGTEIRNNPEWLKAACDQLGDRLGVLYLGLAETWIKKGQPEQAIVYLQRVMQTAPNSRHAEAAQARLAQIQNVSVRTYDLKK